MENEIKITQISLELNEKPLIYDYGIQQFRLDTHFTKDELRFLIKLSERLEKIKDKQIYK